MDRLLALYHKLNSAGARFYTWDLMGAPAVTLEVDGSYGIFMDFDEIKDSAEEAVVVAHEGGHFSTGATHKVSSPYDLVEKHEYKANRWAFEHYLPADELKTAMASGLTEPWQLAEWYGFPESFVRRALEYWTTRRGVDFRRMEE